MSVGFRLTAIWITGVTIALLAALSWSPAVFIEGDILLTGHDSFYHAVRIIEALPNPFALLQFDPKIEAPQGSWVPWPWGFDMAMAAITKAVLVIKPSVVPLNVIVYLPPAWLLLNVALTLAIARALGLGLLLSFIAVMCFALSPLTQSIHGVGRIDHHFAELTVVLAVLLLGVRWGKDTANRQLASWLGLCTGVRNRYPQWIIFAAITIVNGAFWTLVRCWLCGRE